MQTKNEKEKQTITEPSNVQLSPEDQHIGLLSQCLYIDATTEQLVRKVLYVSAICRAS